MEAGVGDIVVFGWNPAYDVFDVRDMEVFHLEAGELRGECWERVTFLAEHPSVYRIESLKSISMFVSPKEGFRAKVMMEIYSGAECLIPPSLLSGKALLSIPPVIRRMPISVGFVGSLVPGVA